MQRSNLFKCIFGLVPCHHVVLLYLYSLSRVPKWHLWLWAWLLILTPVIVFAMICIDCRVDISTWSDHYVGWICNFDFRSSSFVDRASRNCIFVFKWYESDISSVKWLVVDWITSTSSRSGIQCYSKYVVFNVLKNEAFWISFTITWRIKSHISIELPIDFREPVTLLHVSSTSF